MKKHWYTSGDGRFELQLTMEQAITGCHSGQCDLDIAFLRTQPEIKSQLDSLSAKAVADELKSSGAYEDYELLNHDDNLTRILWFACSDIVENNY